MVSEEYDAPVEVEETVLDLDAILASYHRRQRIEKAIGPIVSFLFHVVLIAAAAMSIKGTNRVVDKAVEVQMKELKVNELEERKLDEIEQIEQTVEEVVPTVDKPEIPRATADVSTEAFNEEMFAGNDNEMAFADVLDVKASDTPLNISTLFGGRTDKGRAVARRQHGGDKVTETAVLRALRWLKVTQNPNGSWAKEYPQAMTGLGLLTFLAHGETPESEEFGMTVQNAIKYLADWETSLTPASKNSERFAYINGIVTYALAEAYGVTKLPYVKPAMEKGLSFIVDGQQPDGGFDYKYAKTARWDLSVTGWQVQALKAGFVAGSENEGIMPALDKAKEFIQDVTFRDGLFGYSSPGKGGPGMQGAGTLCLQLIGEGDSRQAKDGVKWIRDNVTIEWDRNKEYAAHSNPVYNWYYQTQAMFHAGRATWTRWNRQMKQELVRNQKPGDDTDDGQNTGYWESPGRWKRPSYDPWYTTCLCTLSLQVYYRYLPTFKMPKKMVKAEKTILDSVDLDIEME
jgi:hypothetical protein